MNFDRIVQTDNKLTGTNTKKYLMFHHTGIQDYDDSVRVLSEGNVSCHYVNADDGRIAKIGEHDDVLWHAGQGVVDGVLRNVNYDAIGIEICSGDGKYFTDAQREAVYELARYIIKKEGIKKENVVRHADFSGYHGKWDVGPNFYAPLTWEEYVETLYEEESKLPFLLNRLSQLTRATQRVAGNESEGDVENELNVAYTAISEAKNLIK